MQQDIYRPDAIPGLQFLFPAEIINALRVVG